MHPSLKELTVEEIAELMAYHSAIIETARARNEEIKAYLEEIAHGTDRNTDHQPVQ